MKCPECGAKMEKDETSWMCPECGYYKLKTSYARLEKENESLFDDFLGEDEKSEGCAACGNPAYPECQSSCPLYDD